MQINNLEIKFRFQRGIRLSITPLVLQVCYNANSMSTSFIIYHFIEFTRALLTDAMLKHTAKYCFDTFSPDSRESCNRFVERRETTACVNGEIYIYL